MSDTSPWHIYLQKLNAANENLFVTLSEIWNIIGFKEHERRTYCEQAYNHLVTLMDDMVSETKDKRDELLNTVASLLKDIHSLSKELQCDAETSNFDDVPLIDVQTILKDRVDGLQQKKLQRLKCLEDLREKERPICESLGIQPIITVDGIPTCEELENFKLYLGKQEAEKARLESIFNEMRSSIMSTMDELVYTPALEFEIIVCSNEQNFVYTASNMVKLRELRDRMKETLDAAKEKATFKREELIALWKYLEVPEESYREFLKRHPGHSLADLHAMNEEIKLCKEKRNENIGKFVGKVREELRELWDMCKFGDEQRKKFKPYYVQVYDESLLTLHDMEVDRLRRYYNKNRKLYQLLNECASMWEKVKELDQRANDPERLHNRGGQLLIEEKERRVIQKKLPKLEEQINALIRQYEADNGVPFTVYGMSYDEFFTRSLEDYTEMKETMKKQRMAKARDKSMKKTPVMSTSRRTPVTATSLLRPGYTSVKKRSEKSPLGNSAKRNRMAHSEKARPTVCTSRIRRSDRVPRRLVKAMNSSNRSAKNEEHTTLDSLAQYEQFQQHLEQREELRSSLLPERVLENARGRSKMRTPVKTPVKPVRKNISSVPSTPNRTPKTSHHREQSRSPKATSTSRLVAAPSKLPFFF